MRVIQAAIHLFLSSSFHNWKCYVNPRNFYNFFIYAEKSGLSHTMYVILPIAAEKLRKPGTMLHPGWFWLLFVLDKATPLWQYIVEVFRR